MRRLVLHIAVCAVLLSACQPAPPAAAPVLVMVFTEVPAGAVRLRVAAALNGVVALEDYQRDISAFAGQREVSLGLRLPVGFAGRVKVDAQIDVREACLPWSGSGEALIEARDAELRVTVAEPDPASCPSCTKDGWCSLRTPVTVELTDVRGSSGEDVWITGAAGTLLHWDGAGFTQVQSGQSGFLYPVWSFSREDVWIGGVGGVILHKIPGALRFQREVTGVPDLQRDLWRLWGRAPNDLWASGTSQLVLHWDGTKWTSAEMGVPAGADIASIFGVGDDLWASGGIRNTQGVLLRWTGAGWVNRQATPPPIDTGSLWGVDDRMFALSKSHRLSRWDPVSGALQQVPLPPELPPPPSELRRISGSGPRDLWIAGERGIILHGDGDASWQIQDSGTTKTLNGIWARSPSDIWAVGYGGTVLRRQVSPR